MPRNVSARSAAALVLALALGSAGCPGPETYFAERFGLGLESVYWGEFHTHSAYSLDAVACLANGPEEAYRLAKDPGGADLDFLTISDHAELQNVFALPPGDPDLWRSLLRIGREANNEDPAAGKVFIVFPGWEYTNTHAGIPQTGSPEGYGHKNVVFKSLDDVPPVRYGAFALPADALARTNADLWERLDPWRPNGPDGEAGALTIVHTPAMNGAGAFARGADHQTDWDFMDADFVRNVEISSKWSSTEGPEPEAADCAAEDDPAFALDPWLIPAKTVRSVLHERWIRDGGPAFRLSFVGGTDTHEGRPGNPDIFACLPPLFRGAITGIAAQALTRDDLWSGLHARHTIAATTGPRRPMLAAVETAGRHLLMGDAGPHDGSARIRALADPEVRRLDLIVDGCRVRSVPGHRLDETLDLDAGRHYMYVRGRTASPDGKRQQVWSSPVYLGPPA